MAKAKKSRPKEKKGAYSRELIMGIIAIIVVIVVVVFLAWLMMPAAGKRGVPKKFRWFQQSWLESPRISVCLPVSWEASRNSNDDLCSGS